MASILFINHYAGSPQHGMEFRTWYLANEWSNYGHRSLIVAASHSHLRREQPTCQGSHQHETVAGQQYLWLKTPPYSGNSLSRMCNMAAFVIRLFCHVKSIFVKFKPDIVICSSTYLFDFFPAWAIGKLYRVPVLYEIKDLWPMSPMILGNLSKQHPYILLLQLAENFIYRFADGIVSVLSNAFSHMKQHGLTEERYQYIPNGISVKEWNEKREPLHVDVQNKIDDLRARKISLVGYAGSHGISNTLDYLIDAAALVRQKPIHFFLIGQGPEKARLIEKARHAGLTNISFIDSIPKKQIPGFLESMDVLYIGCKKTPLYDYGVCPNKLLDYLMAGRPILHAINTPHEPVSQSGAGIVVTAENADAIAAGLDQLLKMDVESRKSMEKQGPWMAHNRYDYKILAQEYLRFIEKIISNNRSSRRS